ncbi:aminodeoxychorismate synthase component I [Croceicoccus naphthovorans]|uniref:Probable branched-chain-amino-acid aminotransferase n=1 Tax=Croceicoccus naphthovorans TaxID=1348774 RepID=A0A0G3XI60_9SPHN|nr:aminodeoxychorismate synthase component I [Croceicoccus naphthovorans]AKM11255.1 aminobenzoate synthetase [Croceicoccus naphthovorans]MBB3989838.1 para-aminobenzoate synthetase/4-amino-4-deoxychorismate lyase [Croceicoccus naphthovorans]
MRKPFILLDDARDPAGGEAAPMRVYRDPVAVFAAHSGDAVAGALAAAEEARKGGAHIAGYLTYEAGLALEPRHAPLLAAKTLDSPLVWLAAFDGYESVLPDTVADWFVAETNATPGPAYLSPLHPAVDREAYGQAFDTIADAILAGDIYQANLTFPLTGRWAGDPLAIHAALRKRAAAGYGALVFDGERHLLSLSPELFFALRGDNVTLKPMKGTRPRAADPAKDAALARGLADSTKDRAENLMITDLMRNDVSRLAEPGSVIVRDAFAVESYPTVHQMTSSVRARLRDGYGAIDLLRAIFPCGSITGAPKIRAMELIDAIETAPRGAYCGAIGRVDPDGDSAFNVAIRTLTLEGSCAGGVRMGVGSGLVADSDADDEWAECLIKGGFVSGATAQPKLIETMRFDPAIGVPLIEFHLARLKESTIALGHSLDRHALRNDIQAFCFLNRDPKRLRVLVATDGTWEIEGHKMPDAMPDPVPVAVLPLPVDPQDWRLRYKTTDRDFYDNARVEAEALGAREVVFVRDDGILTEGSFTNLFVERGGKLLTPPLSRGLLPGVMRAWLIDEGRAEEADLTVSDLADGFVIGNALRGLMPARLIAQD